MILGITIHRPMKKNLEHFRFSRHFPLASKHFSTSDLCIISLASGRQNHQKTKKFTFLKILSLFDNFEQKHEAWSVFNLMIFQEIDSLISESGKVNCSDLRS